MLTLRSPSADAISHFLQTQQGQPVAYSHDCMTRKAAPNGFAVDHLRCKLGDGTEVFERAVSALRAWRMFEQDWVRLESGGLPPEVGTTVAIVVRIGLVWWTNACRVVYVIDELEPIRRVGFANGTLPDHAECGEEVFNIEMDETGVVWYDLLAYSRPRHWLAWLGRPLARATQHRFADGSAAALASAMSKTS